MRPPQYAPGAYTVKLRVNSTMKDEDELNNEMTGSYLPRENANCSVYLSTLGVLLVKKNLTRHRKKYAYASLMGAFAQHVDARQR